MCLVRSIPPHFSIPPESVEVLPGGAANLTCVAVGSPVPVVSWRLGTQDIDTEYVYTSLSLLKFLALFLSSVDEVACAD